MLDIVNGKKERDSKEICTNIKFKEKKKNFCQGT